MSKLLVTIFFLDKTRRSISHEIHVSQNNVYNSTGTVLQLADAEDNITYGYPISTVEFFTVEKATQDGKN